MWDRKELKAKGQTAYKRNMMPCIIAALILAFTGAARGLSLTVRVPLDKVSVNDNSINDINMCAVR